MNFKRFIEATFDPNTTNLVKFKNGDKPYLSSTHSLKINKQGQVVPLDKEDYKDYGFPHLEIQPGAKTVILQKMSPQSLDFRKMINALKSKYHDIENWNVTVYAQAMHMVTGNKKHDRTVSYWLNQETANINDKLPTYFYHGTSTNLWYEGIKQNGLMPRNMTGSSGSYGAQNLRALSQDNLIYLSTHPDAATRTAAQQSANKHGGKQLIIRIDSKGLFPEKFHPDEDSRSKSAQGSINKMSIVGYAGRIPNSIIEPFLMKDGKSLRDQWVKFHDVEVTEHPLTTKLKQGQMPYTSDPEFLALLDAEIIKKKGYSDYEIAREINDAEIKSIIKNAKWVSNARMIISDLDEAYKGHIFKLKSFYPKKEFSDKQQEVIDLLLTSKILSKNKDYYDVYWGYDKSQAIALAKLMGKMTFKELTNQIDDIVQQDN